MAGVDRNCVRSRILPDCLVELLSLFDTQVQHLLTLRLALQLLTMRKRQLFLGISVRNHHASPFNAPLGGAQCCSVHNVNHCFEFTRGEAKTHRHNRVMYAEQPQRLPTAISLELASRFGEDDERSLLLRCRWEPQGCCLHTSFCSKA